MTQYPLDQKCFLPKQALRAFFVEGLSSAEAARRFGYSPSSRVLCHQFRKDPRRPFFLPPAKGPQSAPKGDRVRDQVVALRKQNLSIYDISRALAAEGHMLNPVAVSLILKGRVSPVCRAAATRSGHQRPTPRKLPWPMCAAWISPGLFLFLPDLARLPLDQILEDAGFLGSQMIPAGHAMRSLLATTR